VLESINLKTAQTFEAEQLSWGGLLLQNYPFDMLETTFYKVFPYQNLVTHTKKKKTADEATNIYVNWYPSFDSSILINLLMHYSKQSTK
jgi:hypothetical protein